VPFFGLPKIFTSHQPSNGSHSSMVRREPSSADQNCALLIAQYNIDSTCKACGEILWHRASAVPVSEWVSALLHLSSAAKENRVPSLPKSFLSSNRENKVLRTAIFRGCILDIMEYPAISDGCFESREGVLIAASSEALLSRRFSILFFEPTPMALPFRTTPRTERALWKLPGLPRFATHRTPSRDQVDEKAIRNLRE